VAAEASLAAADAEAEAGIKMLDGFWSTAGPGAESAITLGADTGYQQERFVEALRKRKVAPTSASM